MLSRKSDANQLHIMQRIIPDRFKCDLEGTNRLVINPISSKIEWMLMLLTSYKLWAVLVWIFCNAYNWKKFLYIYRPRSSTTFLIFFWFYRNGLILSWYFMIYSYRAIFVLLWRVFSWNDKFLFSGNSNEMTIQNFIEV